MRAIWRVIGVLSVGIAASSLGAQAALRPTILVDGHVAVDTILSLSLAKLIQSNLTELLRGTGVGVATLFAPDAELNGQRLKGELSEVIAAEKTHHADIAIEINASQAQNGNIFIAPTIVLRKGPSIDMSPASGQNVEAIARTIALRIAKDSTRLRRLAEEDTRGDVRAPNELPNLP